MTKPVADWFRQQDSGSSDEPGRHASVFGDIYSGFAKISFNPTPGLRKFRCALEKYSDEAVTSAWSSTARALATVTDAEMLVHNSGIKGEVYKVISEGALPWKPHHPNPVKRDLSNRESDIPADATVTLMGPDGPVEVLMKGAKTMDAETKERLLRMILVGTGKTETEPPEK